MGKPLQVAIDNVGGFRQCEMKSPYRKSLIFPSRPECRLNAVPLSEPNSSNVGGGKLDRGLSRYGRNKPVALRRPYRLMNERSKRG